TSNDRGVKIGKDYPLGVFKFQIPVKIWVLKKDNASVKIQENNVKSRQVSNSKGYIPFTG
ncbi:hypothetical protein RUM43_000468, partial [Polyplax serrata]